MIAFEWPFLHRTIAEIMDAGEWPDRYGRIRTAPHHQPAPRRDDDGGEDRSVSDQTHEEASK